MRRSFINVILTSILVMALTSGCANDNKEKVTWYENKEDALKQYLLAVDASELTRVKVEQEVLVLYRLKNAEAMGLGSIIYSADKGYRVKEVVVPVLVKMMQLDYESESGKLIPITIGKADDPKQKTVILKGISHEYELPLYEGYYIGFNLEPFYNYKTIKSE